MKCIRAIALCVVLFTATPAVTFMGGCDAFGQSIEDTPRGNYFEIQEAFTAAASIALDAKRSGSISQDDWDSIYNPAIQQGSILLDSMEAAVVTGDTNRLQTLRGLLVGIIEIINGGDS